MRKHHVSAKIKKILAVACAAALVCTSVPAGSFAYADEVTNAEENAGSGQTQEAAEAADTAAQESAQEEAAATAETSAKAAEEEAAEKASTAEAKEPAEEASTVVENKTEEAASETKEEVKEESAKEKAPAADPDAGQSDEKAADTAVKKGVSATAKTVKKAAQSVRSEARNAGPDEDTEAPVVEKAELSDDGRKITITISEEPSDEGWTLSYKKDGTAQEKTGLTGTTVPFEPEDDGKYTDFVLSGKDAAGNALTYADGVEDELSGMEILIDTIAPKVENVTVSEETRTITITISEEPSDEGWTLSYRKDGTADQKTGLTGKTVTFAPKDDGEYTNFALSGKDAAGNDLTISNAFKNTLRNTKILIDNTAPTIEVTSVKADGKSEDQDGQGVAFGSGSITYTFTVKDIYDKNVTVKYTVTSKDIDVSKPEEIDVTGWKDVIGKNEFEVTKNEFEVTASASAKVYVFAVDNEGNASAADFKALVIESNKPSVTVTKKDETQRFNNVITFTAKEIEDPISGIQKVEYSLLDKDGKEAKKGEEKNKRPNSISEINELKTKDGELNIDDSSFNGKYTVKVKATDWCGNESKETTDSVLELFFDHIAPETTITPEEGKFGTDDNGVVVTNDGTISVSIIDTTKDGDPKHGIFGKIYVNDEEKTDLAFNESEADKFEKDYTLTDLGITDEGDYVVKVEAEDGAGNKATEKTFAFSVDTKTPKVSCILPEAAKGKDLDGVLTFNKDSMETLKDQSVEVRFTVDEDHPISEGWKFSYSLNGVPQAAETVSLNADGEYSKKFKDDGKYSDFALEGEDAAQNESEANGEYPSFQISAIDPDITLAMDVQNKEDEYHNDGDFTVKIVDESTGSYITDYKIEVSSEGLKTWTVEETGELGTELSVHVTHQDFVDHWGDNVEAEVSVKVEASTFAENSSRKFVIAKEDAEAIKVSTEEKEGEDVTIGTFIYDTIAPKLSTVTSAVDDKAVFMQGDSGEKVYYISSNSVEDTYTFTEEYPGELKVSYTDNTGTTCQTNNYDEDKKEFTKEIKIVLAGDGVYNNFEVSGQDRAGNTVVTVDNLNVGTVNEVLKQDKQPLVLTYGKVLDTVAPVLTSVTSSVASGNEFYDGKDGYYYVSSDTVTDTYNIKDTNLSTSTVTYKVTYKDKGEDKTATGMNSIEIKMSDDGIYENFTLTGTDKAGNKVQVDEDLNAGTVNEVKKPVEGKDIVLTYGKVLDTKKPTVTFTATKRDYDDSLEGNRRYYRSTFKGVFVVEDNFTLDTANITSSIYRAEESDKYYNNLAAFKEDSTIDPDEDQVEKITYTGEVTADGSHSTDGSYRFFIEGTDKAGNPIVVDGMQPKSGEFALVNSGSGNGTGFRTYDKVLDTVAPKAVMKVVKTVNNKEVSFYTLDMTPSNYKLSDYDPYQKKIASTVKFTTDDKSPVRIDYDISSSVQAGNDSAGAGYGNDISSSRNIPARKQIITISDLVIKDRAGNVLALSGDPMNEGLSAMDKTTLYYSNNLIFDDVAPTTKPNDIVAPTATVKASGSITHRNADGRDLFNGARTLTVTIKDEGEKEYSSGLKNVSYDVYVDGKRVAGDAKTYSEIGASKALNEKTADVTNDTLTYTKKFTIKLTEAYQTNDIEVRVNAEDHSGNKMQTVKYRCGIDSVGPKITVSYDNNSVQNEKYFKADRTATITVLDRNVDNSKIPIRTEVGVPGAFSYSSGGGNGANDRWVKTLSYNRDGDYTLQLGNCTDALGNKATITYQGAAPNAFTIDKTVPVISVTFDNNSYQNGKYFKDPRTATVTIQEHNFRGSDVKITQTGDAASAGGFNEGGDSHSASIYYGTDGDYSFNVNYTDLAGNPAQVVTIDEFTVDMTPPVVRFIEPDEKKLNKNGLIAYTGDIAPEIFYSDKNITKGMAVITLEGAKANHTLDPVEDLFDGIEGTVRFGNLAKVRENDDIYTAVAVVTDLAGNETPVTVVFSVNRFGSTFDYNNDEYTENLMKGYYTQQAQDIVLREINVNELESYSVTLYKDGDNRKLIEGTDFKVEKKSVNGHYEYIYTIFASNFEEEGNYNIVVTSKDKAGNTNTNSSVKGNEGSDEVALRLAVDKTAPTNLITGVDLTKDRFRASEINLQIQPMDNMNAVASFLVRVTDRDGNLLFEQVLTGEELAKFFEEQGGIYDLPITQNTKWQTVEVVTTDAAGNVSTDYTVENNTAYNVLVTPNVFYQYINSKPMLGGTAALIALLIFLIAMKRRKDQEETAA